MVLVRHVFPEHGINIEQSAEGVVVIQNGHRYVARGWRITEDLIEVMAKFLIAGFTCLIRSNHPRPNNRAAGVAYIGFSSNENEPWLAVVDQHSSQRPIKRITVNARFRDLLTAARIPFNWETAGGQNMFVSVEDVDQLLGEITPNVARSVADPSGNQGPVGPRAALTSESALQSLLIQSTQKGSFSHIFGVIKSLTVNPRWRKNAGGLDPQLWDIPDVLVETESALWVLELKLHEVGIQAVHQVSRYVSNPACHSLANGREIRPVAMGFYKSPELTTASSVLARDVEVFLWTYSWSAEQGLALFCQQN